MRIKPKFALWLSIFLSLSLVTVASLSRADLEETTAVAEAAPLRVQALSTTSPTPLGIDLDDAIRQFHQKQANERAFYAAVIKAEAERKAAEEAAAERERARQEAAARPAPPPTPAPAPSGNVWDRLAQCESGGNWAINTGNGYYGGLQFDLQTWHAYGGSGYPHENSREEQIRVAENLRAERGYAPWPACSRKLGLR